MSLEYDKFVLEEADGSQRNNGFSNESATTHSPPLSGTATGYVYKATNYHPREAQSLINFKSNGYNNLINGGESLLNFKQKEYCGWENNLHQWNQNTTPRGTSISDPRLIQNFNCIQTASGYNGAREKLHQAEVSYGWLYSEPNVNVPADNSLQESSGEKEASFNKRPSMGESMQASKKQCTKTSKATKSSQSKDPQSIAAKNRRERISERLKILQELVPNGSKVDLVTMLEKAISYVKFLQLQVKVLATDEFWPVQGGKAPDITQVKGAVDSILSSQRDRNLKN